MKQPVLEVSDLAAAYGHLQVLWDVSLEVSDGEFVTLVGPNGAGKTTTLRAISGLLDPLSGQVTFNGKQITGTPANLVSRMGISFVTEELDLFEQMTVRENLRLGAYAVKDKTKIASSMDLVLELFPRLAERQKQLAGTLSGGERKMLALARGLVSDPRLLLVDEPSLGLAPMLAQSVFEALQALHRENVTILLVEQNVDTALRITDRCYVMEQGQIALQGASADLRHNEYIGKAYLGF